MTPCALHAHENFSLLVCVILSTAIAVLGLIFLRPILYFFGVSSVFMATPAADLLGALLACAFIWKKRKIYGYLS